jgi:hypothetical protein
VCKNIVRLFLREIAESLKPDVSPNALPEKKEKNKMSPNNLDMSP